MSTLATLKAELADDLARSDLTSAIASEITNAIRFYQAEHFYFNETRDKTFDTVASQTWYSGDDDADIPLFVDVDFMHISIGSNRYRLKRYSIERFELLTDGNATSGQPYAYAHYNRQIGLYAIPDQVYTVRIIGSYQTAAPATDDETDNPWMVEAYQLIRSRALANLCEFKVRNYERADRARSREASALMRIQRETSRRKKTDIIQPMDW